VYDRHIHVFYIGNIDHVQYCDKVKVIVDFLGVELTLDELTKLWDMQRGQRSVIVDNIHAILVAAAIRFNTDQLEHLFSLIQQVASLFSFLF
jgi:ubiquitin carboxyl-terminal hydrolase 9/24